MVLHPSFLVLSAVIQTGSFTKAGQKLGLSSAAIGKHIQTLEHKLNLRLFQRTTRTVTPTDAALKLATAVRYSQDYLGEVLDDLTHDQSTPSGRLRVNVPMSYGELFLARPMAYFAALFPNVVLDVDFDDKRVHLIEEGYDLVVRIGQLEDSGLISKKIADFPMYLCAAPKLIETYGTPSTPKDLSDWPFICYSNAPNPSLWSYTDATGKTVSMSLAPALYANSASMMKEACIAGVGLALLPHFCCDAALLTGSLVHVLPNVPTAPDRAVYVIYPDKTFVPLKVRKFIEILQNQSGL